MLSDFVSECSLVLNSREQIIRLQGQVDKQYAGLKDIAEERRRKLENMYHLFQLKREADDLEQWISEKELVASSPEMGQDFDHVTVSTHGDCSLCPPRRPETQEQSCQARARTQCYTEMETRRRELRLPWGTVAPGGGGSRPAEVCSWGDHTTPPLGPGNRLSVSPTSSCSGTSSGTLPGRRGRLGRSGWTT